MTTALLIAALAAAPAFSAPRRHTRARHPYRAHLSARIHAQAKAAFTALQNGNDAEAAEILEQAVRSAPRDPDVVAAYAVALYRANRTNLAVQEWQKALSLDPSYGQDLEVSQRALALGWASKDLAFISTAQSLLEADAGVTRVEDVDQEESGGPKAGAPRRPATTAEFARFRMRMPPGWVVEDVTEAGAAARPPSRRSKAALTVQVADNGLGAKSGEDWFTQSRAINRGLYAGYRQLNLKPAALGGADGSRIEYLHKAIGFKRTFRAVDWVVLQSSRVAHISYDAPENEFRRYLSAAEKAAASFEMKP